MSDRTTNDLDKTKRIKLTIDTIRELWSKTYNTEGKPDWSHLFPYYHPDIYFKDSIQEVRGFDDFSALCNRLADRCKQLKMDIITIAETENFFLFQWEMTMMFKKFPSSTLYGCTRLTIHEDGRIIEQRDHYDLWGDIFDNIPWFRKPYRRFMKKNSGNHMFEYIKDYKVSDMLEMTRNNKKEPLSTIANLRGKIAVISGGTSGVGLAGARALAEAGCNLILLARNEEKAEAVCRELGDTNGIRTDYELADFSNLAQVHTAADNLLRKHPVIDILINSAGLHSTRKIITSEGHELSFCVNHLAPFIVTRKLVPALRKSVRQRGSSARIIQVNSQGHRFCKIYPNDLTWNSHFYSGLRGYGASKTAQLLTVWEFADKLMGSGITINAMHPGAVKSNIGSNNGRLYNWYLHTVVWPTLKEAEVSGKSLLYLAAEPQMETTSGLFFNLTYPEKPAPHALDRSVGKVVWQKSLELTGLEDEI